MGSSFAYRVALVDDHRFFLEGFQNLLSRFPQVSVASYSSPKQMLKEIYNNTPEVIFMDIQMRELNGIDATKKVLELFPNIKVVALTQFSDGFTASKMFSAGAFGYMTKSQISDDLVTVFTCIEKGEKYITPEIAMEFAVHNINGKSVNEFGNKNVFTFTTRELDIINYIMDGKTDKEIGQAIGISPKTVDKDKRNIMKIMKVNKITQIVAVAFKMGLVSNH